MKSKLDRLLESIHPDRTLDEVDRRVDQALNSFTMPAGRIERWDQFRACLIGFLGHVETCVLRLRQPCPRMGAAFDWGRCCQHLIRLYGSNGEKAAFEMARTGNQGGLYSVLKDFAHEVGRQGAENEISAKILYCWNSMSVSEQLAAADEYLAKYGHLLPSELTEGSAARIRANLPKVLEEHPRLVQGLMRVGRA